MLTGKDSYRVELPEGLFLRSAVDGKDVEQLAAFHHIIHDEGVAGMVRELAHHHPNILLRHWLMIFEPKNNQIISSLCLIPWTIRYAGMSLPAAEMGIVGTRKEWRNRGLIRTLVSRFNQMVSEERFLLSHIQGIAYFYRQFGYEYCVPLEPNFNLELRMIDQSKGKKPATKIREASENDIPVLMELYSRHSESIGISALRTEEHWLYQFGPGRKTETVSDTFLVENPSRDVLGYFRIAREGFGKGLNLSECSNFPSEVFAAIFTFLKKAAQKRDKPYIRLNLPEFAAAVQYAKDIGAQLSGQYCWQVRIPDVLGLLRTLKPVMQERLMASEFAAYSGALVLDLYRRCYAVHISSGVINDVELLNERDQESIRMPPNLLPVFLLGQSSFDQYMGVYKDLHAGGLQRRLFEALFPPMTGFLHGMY